VIGFLLDTNVISEAIKKTPDIKVGDWFRSVRDDLLFISVITLGEIRKGILLQQHMVRRMQLESWLHQKVRLQFQGRILDIDEQIADRWGVLTAQARLKGAPLPQIDSLLAATALHRNLTLVTRNKRDVAATGVSLFNPWED